MKLSLLLLSLLAGCESHKLSMNENQMTSANERSNLDQFMKMGQSQKEKILESVQNG